jgi:glucose-6-phosphate 1-epimerase
MSRSTSGNRIERIPGKGGLPFVRISHDSGYVAVVSEYGAQVVSWTDPDERELLFVSEQATFERGKPIRGGIPIVFPQFSKGALPPHGFARTAMWKVVREQVSTAGPVTVTLRLVPDAEIFALWPYHFQAEVDVVLTDVLLLTLRVENVGARTFSFQSALHTYFRTGDVSAVRLIGFEGCEFVDFLQERRLQVEERSEVVVDGPTDRAYRDSPQSVQLRSESDGSTYLITREGFSDTVVWNPWVNGAKNIADLKDNEYREMVCVESGNILAPIVLAPGELYTSAQILRVEQDS